MYSEVFLSGMSFMSLLQLYLCDVQDDDYYNRVAFQLVSLDHKAADYMMRHFDEKRICGILFAISSLKLMKTKHIMYTKSLDDKVAACAFDGFISSDINVISHAKAAFNSRRSIVKSAAFRYLCSKLKGKELEYYIQKACESEDALIRQNAADELLAVNIQNDVKKRLIAKLKVDLDEDVRSAAEFL